MPTAAATMRLLGSSEVDGELAVDDVAGLAARLRPAAARDEPLLVLTSAAGAERARHTVSLARAAAPGSGGVVHGSALPPLARDALVQALAAVSQESSNPLGASQLLVVCEALERAAVAGAVVSSVTRLGHPGPSMVQHLRSWWPGSRFIALTHPYPQVSLVRDEQPGDLALTDAVGIGPLTRTTGDDATGEAVDALAVSLTGSPATRLEPPTGSRARWGTGRFTEFVALPADLGVLTRTALDAADECRSCSALVSASSCPFCHSRRWPLDETDVGTPVASSAPLEPTARPTTRSGARAAGRTR